jgi:hypothetical protein
MPSPTFRSSWIRKREYFPNLINSRPHQAPPGPPLLRAAVEIGTHRGEFAERFLQGWAGHGVLHCVDPWIDGEKGIFDQPDAWGNRGEDYAECLRRLQPWIDKGRAVILKMTSAEAVLQFRDGSLDFIYIDGNHRRPHVDEDLRLWWPKVKPGGIFAGHDLTGIWGDQVKPAVEEWAEREGIGEVWMVPGVPCRQFGPMGDCASWLVYKAENERKER